MKTKHHQSGLFTWHHNSQERVGGGVIRFRMDGQLSLFPPLDGVRKTTEITKTETQLLTIHRSILQPSWDSVRNKIGEEVISAPHTAGDPWEEVYPRDGQCQPGNQVKKKYQKPFTGSRFWMKRKHLGTICGPDKRPQSSAEFYILTESQSTFLWWLH